MPTKAAKKARKKVARKKKSDAIQLPPAGDWRSTDEIEILRRDDITNNKEGDSDQQSFGNGFLRHLKDISQD